MSESPSPGEQKFQNQMDWEKRTRRIDEYLSSLPPTPMSDLVNHPPHYTGHPSGVECIQITEHMGFNLGNAIKYIWRADLKNDAVEDLKKARWYLDREIARRGNAR